MEQIQINSPEDIGKLIDFKTSYIKKMIERSIDAEIGIMELNLSLSCLESNHMQKAHADTENFKNENWKKAKELSIKNKTDALKEYKKLISFI